MGLCGSKWTKKSYFTVGLMGLWQMYRAIFSSSMGCKHLISIHIGIWAITSTPATLQGGTLGFRTCANMREVMSPSQIAILCVRVASYMCAYIFLFKRSPPILPYIVLVQTCGKRKGPSQICWCPFLYLFVPFLFSLFFLWDFYEPRVSVIADI